MPGTARAQDREERHENDQADGGAGGGAVSRGAAERRRRGAVRGRLGDLRAWQRCRAGRGASCGGRRPADLSGAQRAVDGACGDCLCEGERPAADDGGDVVHRPRRDEHGDGRCDGASEPAAGPVPARRRVCLPRARSGVAAAGGLSGRDGQRERLLPPRQPLFRPHFAARTRSDGAAARGAHPDGSGRVRAGDARLLPGHPGGSLRLPGGVLRDEGLAPAPHPSRSGRSGGGGGDRSQGEGAGDRGRWRRALFRRHQGAQGIRGTAQRADRRDAGRQVGAALGSRDEFRPRGRDRVGLGQRAGREGGRGDWRGYAVPGFHHRLVVAVQEGGPADRGSERAALRRDEAWRHAARGRRPGRAG